MSRAMLDMYRGEPCVRPRAWHLRRALYKLTGFDGTYGPEDLLITTYIQLADALAKYEYTREYPGKHNQAYVQKECKEVCRLVHLVYNMGKGLGKDEIVINAMLMYTFDWTREELKKLIMKLEGVR